VIFSLRNSASTLSFERYILKEYGQEKGYSIIESIAASNPAIVDLEHTNAGEEDKRTVIKNLLAFTKTGQQLFKSNNSRNKCCLSDNKASDWLL